MRLRVTCRICQRVLRVPLGKPVYFHRCCPPRPYSLPGFSREEVLAEDRLRWAHRMLGAFEDAVSESERWRRL